MERRRDGAKVEAVARTRLGELLLERGWITRADLARALKTQQVLGGRLGTCLLEIEALSEELLDKALAEVHGVDAVGVEDLRHIDAETLALVPRRLAVRHRSVPVRSLGGRLELAMDDPGDLDRRDEIAFASSRRVHPLAANEARILEALERYYDEPCPGRYARLLDQLNRRRYLWNEAEGANAAATLFPEAPDLAPPPLPDDAPRPAAVRRPAPRPRQRSVELSEAERQALYGGRPEPPPPPAPSAAPPAVAPESFAAAEERLAQLDERDEVGRFLLAFLRRFFDRVVLFAVRRDGVHGWMAAGEGLAAAQPARVAVPFDRPSIFLNLERGSVFHLGPLPPLPAHGDLVDLLGGDVPAECLLLPVRLGDRMVVVIYGDRGGKRLTGVDLEALRRLAQCVTAALERCISLKRQAQSGTSAG